MIRRTVRSIGVFLFVFAALGLASFFPYGGGCDGNNCITNGVGVANAAMPDFRIIAVSEHDGQLLVEVEHFKADGSFNYFENYLWQGREGNRFPRAVNGAGLVLLQGGGVAPFTMDPTTGRLKQYLPLGRQWQRDTKPFLDRDSILSTIQGIHDRRADWVAADWPNGRKRGQSRLIEKPLSFVGRDHAGIATLVRQFRGMAATAYHKNGQGELLAYAGVLPAINPGLGLVEYGTVSTFFPDGSPETDTVDGYTLRGVSSETWGTIQAGAGTASNDSGSDAFIHVLAHASTTDRWIRISKVHTGFDTSTLGSDIINSATYEFVTAQANGAKADDFTDSLSLVLTTLASNTALADADHIQWGTAKQAADITVSSVTDDESTFNVLTLNGTGLSNINTSGITNLGLRSTADLNAGAGPTWQAGGQTIVGFATAEEILSGDKRPKLVVTHTPATAVITGTLGGSGGTPSEIVAGGETVIITLTDATWVASGGTFDAERQAILDGLESDLSDQNGWDSLAFAVGDVVRTSGTVVTITLTAESAYTIPATETITVTVPGSAIGGSDLVATPTFAITPSFQTFGTRVSTAIDLSSVTDVAYCAIGWEATTPTNTTVLIETSVDGGTTFSTATNGSCPTGLTVGASLATITDFRVRITLTTTDTSVTPLIEALGLIVEDTSGQELYYQLNTTPSATLTDRSGNSNTGTMSFPIAPSGISNSTEPLESTESPLTTQQALRSQQVTSEVTGSATPPNLFSSEVGFTGLPGKGIVDAIATAGDGLPTRFVWFIFLGMFIIAAGMVTLAVTGDLLASGIVMGIAMGMLGAIGGGLLPMWTLYTYIPMVASFMLFRKGFLI